MPVPSVPVCPWTSFEPTSYSWCEERVCGWIKEPANAWSNIAYLVVGVALIVRATRDRRFGLVHIGVTETLIAFGSFFFHASATFVGEVADVMAMLMFSLYMLTANLRRALGWSSRREIGTYVVACVASLAILLVTRGLGILLFSAQIIVALSVEAWLFRRLHPRRSYYVPLRRMGAMFAFAYAIWWLDVLRVVCLPSIHWISGHAIWHVLNSTCFWFLYSFYVQAPPGLRASAPIEGAASSV